MMIQVFLLMLNIVFKRYDVVTVAGINKLIRRSTKDDNIQYFACIEEMYHIIQSAHVKVGHGGIHKTTKEVITNYANVTRDAISVFLSNCEPCITKKSRQESRKTVVKPITSSDFNSRAQVDLIDMQSQPDGDFKWIFHYQDHLTKFSTLRPLTSKRASEVAYTLLDVFLTFGAPQILQSDNGREFTAEVITELKTLWPELTLVHGRPRHPQSQGSVERANGDIKGMLTAWLMDNNTVKWSEGLKFVQFSKNRSFHTGIKQSPYEALFGSKPKVGLSTSNVPLDIIPQLQSEEDLMDLVSEPDESCNEADDNDDTSTNTITVVTDVHHSVLNESMESRTAPPEISFVEQDNHSTERPAINTPPLLTPMVNSIVRARIQAKRGLQQQAETMRNTRRRLDDASLGDNVIIPIPDVDRGPLDGRNMHGVEVTEEGYKLGTRGGRLDSTFARNQFEVIDSDNLDVNDIPEKTMCLREMVRDVGFGQGHFHCVCKTQCATKRCKCIKANVKCNSRCHHSLTCKNK